MLFKRFAAFIHLWGGLLIGSLIVVISITGCITVFSEELFDVFHKDLVSAKSEGKPALSLSVLAEKAASALPEGNKISKIEIPGGEKSYVFIAQETEKRAKGLTYFDQVKFFKKVFVNPYTGAVLGQLDMKYEFFNVVLQLHRYLLLKKDIGSLITGITVLIFLLMLISGLVIWLPKKFKNASKKLKINFKSKFKRLNHQLHTVLGMYVLPVALVIVFTGLSWSFKWWESGMLKAMGGNKRVLLANVQPTPAAVPLHGGALDQAFSALQQRANGNYEMIGFTIPAETKKSASGYITMNDSGDAWLGMSYFSIDHNSGAIFDEIIHKNKGTAMKWRNSNEAIHTGKIYGWPTQALAFFASLICATLPVSGFLIWLRKRKKQKVRLA
ncbi:PepSY-associated TM helix domain-containing protein [Pedobacter gandavensis]|uniref:PepSY-associated TM helix domain-containing protein n=1 Tax=Pedobacter gandavensis TaxID=2679963 RepID=UPI0024785206|nr:PepSY-associated TM helix domain-containing protein [Pedobacter gandavensis]WGQ07533.1 PepSY-associated TM helix domain-containing protein [Pedobacter gandavensis]